MPERTHQSSRVDTLLEKWAALWGLPGLGEGITVSFSPRLQRGLGRCAPERGRITLHSALRTAAPKRLTEVLCHEAAHVAAFVLYGRSVNPHGPEWAGLVSQVGFTPGTRAPGVVSRKAKAPASDARRIAYEHRCAVCQTVRFARRPVPRWRCAECVASGLSGEMTITRHPLTPERV